MIDCLRRNLFWIYKKMNKIQRTTTKKIIRKLFDLRTCQIIEIQNL